MNIQERFQKTWQDNSQGCTRVLLAVSGGADSMALFSLFHNLPESIRPEIQVAHFEHGLRGEESLKDLEFVRSETEKLELPFFIGKPVAPYAGGSSLEEWAREARYEWLGQIAQQQGCQAIATGHHGDDQAETILMNIFRGSGLNGLAGIPQKRRLSPELPHIMLVRPMLTIRKKEILQYLQQNNIKFRHDSSNDLIDRKRNKVRHTLFPAIEKDLQCDPADALVNLSLKAQQANHFLRCEANRILKLSLKSDNKFSKSIPLVVLRNIEPALRNQLFIALFELLDIPSGDSLSRTVESINCLIESEEPQLELHLPDKWKLRKVYDDLVLVRNDVHSEPYRLLLPVPGRVILPSQAVIETEVIEQKQCHMHHSTDPSHEYFDLDEICLPYYIRTREPGDTIALGAGKSKKIKDLFIDSKIPSEQREQWPIVVDSADTILWVVGLKRAADYWVNETTEKVLLIKVQENQNQSET